MTVPGRRKLTIADLKPKAKAAEQPPPEQPKAKLDAKPADKPGAEEPEAKKRTKTPARRAAVARKRARRRNRIECQITLPEIAAQLAEWAARYPAVFTRPVPLARGIRKVILADGAGTPPALVAAALGFWTRRAAYGKAILSGSARYDLQGNPCGEVTKEDKAVLRRLPKQPPKPKPPAQTAEPPAPAPPG